MEQKEVYDSFAEHQKWHQSYHNDCSECFAEAKVIREFREANYKILSPYHGINK